MIVAVHIPLLPDSMHSVAAPDLAAALFAVTGVLKGYDQLLNLVLDDAVEYLRGK